MNNKPHQTLILTAIVFVSFCLAVVIGVNIVLRTLNGE